MLQGKYIEYTPDITLEVFSKVWDVLIKAGWKSVANQTVIICYEDFKKKRFFSYASDPMFFSVYDVYLANDVKVTVDQLLGFDNWCIKITPEVKEVLQHSDILWPLGYDYTMGAYYGKTQGKEWGKGGQPKEYHTLITIEQLKEKVGMKSFTLPPRWYVVVTPENQEVVSRWRWPKDHDKLHIGKIAGSTSNYGEHVINDRGHNPRESTSSFGDFEITYEQFKKYVLKEGSFVLPTIWCVSLNDVSKDTLEKWTGNNYNQIRGYTSYSKNWFSNIPSECTEISFEQFEKYVFKIEPFVLPEKWCVGVTKETREALLNWRDAKCLDKTSGYCYCPGYELGTFRKGTSVKGYYEEKNDIGYPVITFEQFKRYVLGETDAKPEVKGYKTEIVAPFKGCYFTGREPKTSGRGQKVIEALMAHGGKNPHGRDGSAFNEYYFLGRDNEIKHEGNIPTGYTLMELEEPREKYFKIPKDWRGAIKGGDTKNQKAIKKLFEQNQIPSSLNYNADSFYYFISLSGKATCERTLERGYFEADVDGNPICLTEPVKSTPKPVFRGCYFGKSSDLVRGKKIIDALLKEGGNNPIERDGTSTNYYFIDHNGDIDYEPNVPSGYTLMQLEGEAAPMKVAPVPPAPHIEPVKPQPKKEYYKGAMLGNPNRGGEVLEFFRQRGATGVNGFNGRSSAYYYMDDNGNMKCGASYLPDGYVEVFLPETSSLLPKPIEIGIVDKSVYFPKVEEIL